MSMSECVSCGRMIPFYSNLVEPGKSDYPKCDICKFKEHYIGGFHDSHVKTTVDMLQMDGPKNWESIMEQCDNVSRHMMPYDLDLGNVQTFFYELGRVYFDLINAISQFNSKFAEKHGLKEDTKKRTVSEICQRYCLQGCFFCESFDCCDNENRDKKDYGKMTVKEMMGKDFND